jgi:diacylglycerol kinase family enzyme
MSGIGVILNPKSAARRLAKTLGDHGVVREARSLDELHRIAEDFRALSIDVLGISGGDGTNHVTITGFLDVYGHRTLPQVAFLRGGTQNNLANSVGIRRGQPEGLLERLIAAYIQRASQPLSQVERRVMRIGGEGVYHYGFLMGTGVVCGFLSEYYGDGELISSPLVAATKTLARGVGSTIIGGQMIRRMAAPFRGSVTFDDGTSWEERDYLSIAAGTIDRIGLNFRPFYRYAERDDAFHALGIYATPMQFVWDLPRIWRAEPMSDHRTYEACSSKMTIRSATGSMQYMIDGDLHAKHGDLDVSLGPHVRIVVGT